MLNRLSKEELGLVLFVIFMFALALLLKIGG